MRWSAHPRLPWGHSAVRFELMALACAIGMQASTLLPGSCRAQAADPAMSMNGLYGQYSMSREASGTSWQPESTPLPGTHDMSGQWMTMWHGAADLIYDDQGGPRGDTKTFSSSMLMFMDGALSTPAPTACA